VDPGVAALSKSIVFSRHDAEKDTLLAAKYGVVAYPTLVLVKPNGMEIDRIIGFLPPEDFIPAVVDVLQNRNTLDDYLTRLAKSPSDLDLRMSVAEKYQYRGESETAEEYYWTIVNDDPSNLSGHSDDCLLAIGRMDISAEAYETAVDLFERLQSDYPESELFEEANIYVPYTYMKAGKTEKAIERFEQFKIEFPESEELEWVDKKLTELREDGN
jgi:tetratricopeptide (TPR) repeat protein